jgi:serine/threonine protein kinase
MKYTFNTHTRVYSSHLFVEIHIKTLLFTCTQVYIIDFGLAKKYRDSSTHQHIPYRWEDCFCLHTCIFVCGCVMSNTFWCSIKLTAYRNLYHLSISSMVVVWCCCLFFWVLNCIDDWDTESWCHCLCLLLMWLEKYFIQLSHALPLLFTVCIFVDNMR